MRKNVVHIRERELSTSSSQCNCASSIKGKLKAQIKGASFREKKYIRYLMSLFIFYIADIFKDFFPNQKIFRQPWSRRLHATNSGVLQNHLATQFTFSSSPTNINRSTNSFVIIATIIKIMVMTSSKARVAYVINPMPRPFLHHFCFCAA